MALTGYSIPPGAVAETPATSTEKALMDRLVSIMKRLSMLDENLVEHDDIETDDIIRNTER